MKLDRFDLAAVLVLVITFALVAAAPFGPKALGDGDFHKHAKRLASAIKGVGPFSEVEIRKAPGPILYYLPPYLTVPVGSSDRRYWATGVIWSASWMVVALLLVRRTARRLGGEAAGKAASCLALLSPFSVYYSFGIAAEGPAYVSMALFLYGWVRGANADAKRAWRWHVVAAAGLMFLMLCRPNAALIPVFALVAASRLWRTDRAAARVTAAGAVATIVLFVAAGALISLLHGGPARSNQTGYFWITTLQGRYQFRTELTDWRFWDTSTRSGSKDFVEFVERDLQLRREASDRGAEVQDVFREWVIADTLAHPFLTVRMALVRVLSMHVNLVNSKPPSAFAVGPLPGALVYWTFHGFVNLIGLSISALALYFLWTRRSGLAAIWPLWVPWLALILFHAVVYAEPRYLLPAKYGQVVMAGCAIGRLLGQPRAAAAVEEAA